MKLLLLIPLFASCVGSRYGRYEIEVKHVFVTVSNVTPSERFGQSDRLIVHLLGDNGIHYWLETTQQDSAVYFEGRRYPFLSPR